MFHVRESFHRCTLYIIQYTIYKFEKFCLMLSAQFVYLYETIILFLLWFGSLNPLPCSHLSENRHPKLNLLHVCVSNVNSIQFIILYCLRFVRRNAKLSEQHPSKWNQFEVYVFLLNSFFFYWKKIGRLWLWILVSIFGYSNANKKPQIITILNIQYTIYSDDKWNPPIPMNLNCRWTELRTSSKCMQ